MEPKKRLFIAFSITIILMVAIFTSIGKSLISLSTPSVTLPNLTPPSSESNDALSSSLSRIDITPKTVQSVITALQSLDSYYRGVTITLFGKEGQEVSRTLSHVWYHDGVHSIKKQLPSGVTRCDITTEDSVYFWYEGYDSYLTQSSNALSPYVAQYIPSYQTILNLGVESIHVANYQLKEGIPCIYVEATPPPLYYTERFWVSTETGLLIASETFEGGTLIYRMEAYEVWETPLEDFSMFVLPDGSHINAVS